MAYRLSLLTVWMLLLEGCHLTPTHSPEALVAPKTTRVGIAFVSSTEDLSRSRWWEKMHDPVLNQLIQEALVHNNQIHMAAANVVQAEAKLKASRFAWLPTLSASGNAFVGGGWDTSFAPEGRLAQTGLLQPTGAIRFKGYYAGFVPKYSLNIYQNIQNDNFSKASLAMQKATYQNTRLTIISQVAGAYFMLLGQQEQLREQQTLIRDLKAVYALERVRFKDGMSDLSTVTSLEQQIATDEADIPPIENSMAQTENALQVLLNHNPGPIVARGSIHRLSMKGLIPRQLPSAVLKNRPDLITSVENLNMAKANIGIAYANFFPNIPLTGLLGATSFELVHLLKLSTGLWIANAAASMPLLNGADYEQVKVAKAGYNAAYFTYVQTLKSAFADVDNSLTNQQKMNAVYAAQVRALQAAEKAYDLALARYKAGSKDYREVLNARASVDVAKLALNAAKMQQLDSIVSVYQSVAGGYTEAP